MKRITVIIAVIALVFGSLIAFPAYLPGMIAIWVTISLIANAVRQPMWPWLVGCLLIVIAKRPGWTFEFWIWLALFVSVIAVDWNTTRDLVAPWNRRRVVLLALILILGTTIYGVARWFAANTSQVYQLSDRPIACLGDSLTDYGYPQDLEKLLTVPVADFGIDGIRTEDGIKMIPKILAANPQIVVIELGGHDFNAENKPRARTRENLCTLIEAFLEQGIPVILVEIPRGFISDPYDGLERELSAKYDLQLIDDTIIRNLVFNSPIIPPGMWLDPSQHYSDDGLHPNRLGNQYFARVVSGSLTKVFGNAILR
jgi:lysophospholipase L1-like esterase